jgi:hypothetical protein
VSLFDAYVFVDWSAAQGAQPRRPRPDAIWVGERVPALDEEQETYHQSPVS